MAVIGKNLSPPESLMLLKWLTSPLPTSVNHHEEVNISKYGENMKTVLRAISVWFAFSLECCTLWARVTPQSQFCGAYLSLRIIIMMIAENFSQLLWGLVWPKMGNTCFLKSRQSKWGEQKLSTEVSYHCELYYLWIITKVQWSNWMQCTFFVHQATKEKSVGKYSPFTVRSCPLICLQVIKKV